MSDPSYTVSLRSTGTILATQSRHSSPSSSSLCPTSTSCWGPSDFVLTTDHLPVASLMVSLPAFARISSLTVSPWPSARRPRAKSYLMRTILQKNGSFLQVESSLPGCAFFLLDSSRWKADEFLGTDSTAARVALSLWLQSMQSPRLRALHLAASTSNLMKRLLLPSKYATSA